MEHIAVNMFSEYTMQHVIFLVICGIILLFVAMCLVIIVCEWKNNKAEKDIEKSKERMGLDDLS